MLKKKVVFIKKFQKKAVNLPEIPLSTKFFFKIDLITKFWLFFFGVYYDFCSKLFFIKETRFLLYNVGDKPTRYELYIRKVLSQEDELIPKKNRKKRRTLQYFNVFKKYLSMLKSRFYWSIYIFGVEYMHFYQYINILFTFEVPFQKFRLLKNKYIQKGNKLKKVGISIRTFFKKYEDNVINTTFNSCLLIVRFKRKNLFLTLLNNEGNVLCKTNIGSCGFKKKVKFTGFAIKRTSKRFSKKILGAFVRTVFSVRKNCKKHMRKIHNLIFLRQKLSSTLYAINILRKKDLKVNNSISFFKLWVAKLRNKQVLRKKLKKLFILKKFVKYRKYPHHRKSIRKAFKVNLRAKSNLKFWGFRFVMYGLRRYFRRFNSLELRMPIPHSKGLRLKKKRRI